MHDIPPEYLGAAQSLELGREYCGAAAASLQPLVADKQRIACDPNGGLVRQLGATAYACYPLKASDGRLPGTFAVASATRESFTDDDIVWLGTITNFLAQAWERFEVEQGLRASEERFRSSLLHSPLPILLFDDREQILAISQSWLEQTGYSREELRRIEDWTARAYGERSGEVLEQIRRTIPTELEAKRAERMIRTKDGRDRLWSFVTSALGDGPRLFICIAQDVTERKAHEEQVHLLMHEANHRAKNMLSLVQQSPGRPRLVSLKTLSGASRNASRRSQPIRTCSSGTSGTELMWRIWRAPSSRTLRTLSGLGSLWMARSCV